MYNAVIANYNENSLTKHLYIIAISLHQRWKTVFCMLFEIVLDLDTSFYMSNLRVKAEREKIKMEIVQMHLLGQIFRIFSSRNTLKHQRQRKIDWHERASETANDNYGSW